MRQWGLLVVAREVGVGLVEVAVWCMASGLRHGDVDQMVARPGCGSAKDVRAYGRQTTTTTEKEESGELAAHGEEAVAEKPGGCRGRPPRSSPLIEQKGEQHSQYRPPVADEASHSWLESGMTLPRGGAGRDAVAGWPKSPYEQPPSLAYPHRRERPRGTCSRGLNR